MGKSDDDLAEYYKYKAPNHFAGWKSEEVIEYAKEKDPDFANKAKVFYGDGTAEKSAKAQKDSTYPEEQFKNQNPEVRSLDTAQKMLSMSVPEPIKGAFGVAAKGIEKVSEVVQKPFDALKKSPTLRAATVMSSPALGIIMAAADAGKVVSDGGTYLVNKADEMAEGGNVKGASAVAALGGLMKAVPSKESDVLLSVAPIEELVAPAAKFGAGAVKETSKMIEDVTSFLPGAAIVSDAFKAGKSATKENLAFKARVRELGKQMTYTNNKIKEAEASLKPIKDSITYGEFAKKGLDFQEELSKAPLVSRTAALNANKEMSVASSVADMSQDMAKIGDELTGVISATDDKVVERIVQKYLPSEPKAGDSIYVWDPLTKKPKMKVELPIAQATPSDLLKDRSRIGQAYMRALRSGVLDTEQSTALLRLQSIIDDGIERRLAANPKALEEMKAIRQGWRQHYDKFASKTAIAVRQAPASEVIKKIEKTASSIEEARNILPTAAFEKLASDEASILIDKMSKAENASKFLKDELTSKRGYYERLLGQSQVDSLAVLANHKVNLAGMRHEMEGLAESINGSFGSNKRARATMMENLRRAGDTGKANKQLAAVGGLEIAATVALVAHSPGLAAVLSIAGVAPGAFALAYYSGGRAVRATVEKAFSRIMKLGKAAPKGDIKLIQSLGVAGSTSALAKQQETKHEVMRKINDIMRGTPKAPEAKPQNFPGIDRSKDGLDAIINREDPTLEALPDEEYQYPVE